MLSEGEKSRTVFDNSAARLRSETVRVQFSQPKKKFFAKLLQSYKNTFRSYNQAMELELDQDILAGKSFGFMDRDNSVRMTCFTIIRSKTFEVVINLIIFTNFFILCIDSPIQPPDRLNIRIGRIFEIIFGFCFIAQMMIEMIVFGLIRNGETSYLRQSYRLFEFLLNCIFLVSLIPGLAILRKSSVLRIFRVFKLIKMLSVSDNVLITINSLIRSIKAIFNLIILDILIFYILAIFNLRFFKGQLFYCDLYSVPEHLHSQVLNKFDCVDLGGDWINPVNHFDNIVHSMGLVFELVTSEGWVFTMQKLQDIRGVDQQPIRNSNFYVAFYIMALIIITNFLLLNFFIGVLIETFTEEKNKIGGYCKLSTFQKRWVDIQSILFALEPLPKFKFKEGSLRSKILAFFEGKIYKRLEPFSIVLISGAYLFIHYRQPSTYEGAVRIYLWISFFLFLFETFFKVTAYCGQIWKNKILMVDVCVILLEVVSFFLLF